MESETSEQRESFGKPVTGEIRLSLRQKNDEIVLKAVFNTGTGRELHHSLTLDLSCALNLFPLQPIHYTQRQ